MEQGLRTHTLTRFDSGKDGTIGRLLQWRTLEEEDAGNRSNISSIPPGWYKCTRTMYVHGGYETFEITGVPDRTRILFHRGNTEEDTAGCVLVGKKFGVLQVLDEDTGLKQHKLATLQSKDGFDEFMEFFVGTNEWMLEIRDY